MGLIFELTFSYLLYQFIDRNCIRILAPKTMVQEHPALYIPGEHIGHISRDAALVLSEFMDSPHPALNENNIYGLGFKIACRLRDDTNHTSEGYLIDVVVFSINSDPWTHLFLNVLAEKNIFCHKLN
jgi:hypothetical protein